MARLLRHRQTKGAETATPSLTFTAPHSYSTTDLSERSAQYAFAFTDCFRPKAGFVGQALRRTLLRPPEKVRTMRFTAHQHLKALSMVADKGLKDLLRTTARLAHQSAAPRVPSTLPTAKTPNPFPEQPVRGERTQLGHPLKNGLREHIA